MKVIYLENSNYILVCLSIDTHFRLGVRFLLFIKKTNSLNLQRTIFESEMKFGLKIF